jgi:hypothetical protein
VQTMILELTVGALCLFTSALLFRYTYVKIRAPGSTLFVSDIMQNAAMLAVLMLAVVGVAYMSSVLVPDAAPNS